jgi:hypothetical protein
MGLNDLTSRWLQEQIPSAGLALWVAAGANSMQRQVSLGANSLSSHTRPLRVSAISLCWSLLQQTSLANCFNYTTLHKSLRHDH